MNCNECLKNDVCKKFIEFKKIDNNTMITLGECNHYISETNKNKSKWNMFRNFMFNELQITKENIIVWIKDAITPLVKRHLIDNNLNYILEDQVYKFLKERFYKDNKFTYEVNDIKIKVADELLKILINNKDNSEIDKLNKKIIDLEMYNCELSGENIEKDEINKELDEAVENLKNSLRIKEELIQQLKKEIDTLEQDFMNNEKVKIIDNKELNCTDCISCQNPEGENYSWCSNDLTPKIEFVKADHYKFICKHFEDKYKNIRKE